MASKSMAREGVSLLLVAATVATWSCTSAASTARTPAPDQSISAEIALSRRHLDSLHENARASIEARNRALRLVRESESTIARDELQHMIDAGEHVPRGSTVWLLVSSANRVLLRSVDPRPVAEIRLDAVVSRYPAIPEQHGASASWFAVVTRSDTVPVVVVRVKDEP
jgi:hypothetical protein